MKKRTTKYMNCLLLSAGVIALASTPLISQSAPKAPKPKKEIMHLFLQEKMANEGVIADAKGDVKIHVNQESKGKKQDVDIKVKHLQANTSYSLLALVDGETNSTSILGFTTDKEGKASIEFREKGKTENKPGKVKQPLPAALDPVSGILELTISDATAQAVLTADLTSPDKLEYLLKRDLSTGGIKASLQIEANKHKAKVRLEASGLSPNSQYSLALNGSVAKTGTADEHGKLKIKTELPHPLDILSLQSVDLLDSTAVVVLSTTLP